MHKSNYKTKQREMILNHIAKYQEAHFTADDLLFHLKENGHTIGKSTTYRQLENFITEGKLRKYHLEEGMPACFQYVENTAKCTEHFHLKCTICGRLIHVVCQELDGMADHIRTHHKFQVNHKKTVLYGKCEDCMDTNLK